MRPLALLLPLLALAACAPEPEAVNAIEHAGMDHGAPAGTTASAKQTDAAMDRMHQAMGRASDDPDETFLRMMIAHHQGAIDMARIAVADGKDDRVRKLARDIIVAQEREIKQMRTWLAERKAAKPAS